MISSQEQIKDLILNFEFVKLEKLFKDQIEARVGDPVPNLGILSMIRAFITKSELDFNLAIEELEDAQKKSDLNFNDLTLKLYPAADLFTLKGLQLSDDPRFISDPQDNSAFVHVYIKRLMAELSKSECVLFEIFLKCIFTGEHSNILLSLLSETELTAFRGAFMTIYHSIERFKQLPTDHFMVTAEFSEYRDGLFLAWGLCSLLVLLLPSPLAVILGTSEFQLSMVSQCLEVIEIAGRGKSLHAILANLILVLYSCELKEDANSVKKYLDALGSPKSAMSQYFQSKLMLLQGNTFGSIEILTKIRISPMMVQSPVYWQMIQCFAEGQRWPEAIQYIKALRESGSAFPSKIFYLYLEASFMQASTGRAFGPLSIEVQSLLKKVLEASRAKHKAPRPFLDRLAIARSRNVIERHEHFYLPQFEILLLWDRLKMIDHGDFVVKQVRKSLESSGELTFEQQTLGWLILAVLSKSPESSIKLINNHILPREKALPPASFTTIRAKCELGHCLLLQNGNGDEIEKLLKEIEMLCFDKNGFPGQGTILSHLFKLKNFTK